MPTISGITAHDRRNAHLFQELGYAYAFGPDIGPDSDHPERADYTETLLLERLRTAIHKLNPAVPKDIRDEALRMVRDAAHGGLMTQNNLIQRMLVEGVRVAHQVDGEERGVIVRLLDDEHPEKNDFLVANQYTVIHDRINRRADLVVFVNGIPLGLFELKNMADANATTRRAWNQLQTYQADIPNLMAYNAVLVISDGLKAAVGCLGAPYERFLPWKTIDGQELMDRGDDPLRFLIHGIFAPRRFLDLLRYFIVFEDHGRQTLKKLAAYHQFHAAQKALLTTLAARQNTRIDWSIREQAQAHLRRMVKRVLRKHGYPPDMQEGAVDMVIQQAEGFGVLTCWPKAIIADVTSIIIHDKLGKIL